MLSSNEIRQQFIDFFVKKHGHTFVPSSPVVPHDDPTLLFTNAGMNQFKDVFLGTGSRPYRRAANTQKCIRAGGKQNDLDDVGKDTYHHTFFEMLGNWSFGDYFKREAIRWAWELLTEVWKLDKTRLHATVFEGSPGEDVPRDDEAFELWKSETDIDPSHIHWGNKKDNFWEMGDTGPCGPCSEIHIDRTPNRSGGRLVNAGRPEVIEIWNLVFIQYNRGLDGKLTPLPAKHVDTGMGFERLTAVMQGKESNYDTEIFLPLFQAIQKITGAPKYTGKLDDLTDTAYRVIADHVRALTFALTDGGVPSNVGRGYVLRSILRRAERYGWQHFGTKEPFLYKLVPTVVMHMGGSFPELKRNPEKVQEVIRDEEQSFLRTLERAMAIFNRQIQIAQVLWGLQAERGPGGEPKRLESPEGTNEHLKKYGDRKKYSRPVISDVAAYEMHDTHGLFIDIVEQMAAERGFIVDREGFEKLREEARRRNRERAKQFNVSAVQGELPKTDDSPKYGPQPLTGKATVLGWVKDNAVVTSGRLSVDEEVALLLDRSPFYAEQGGQVGDTGVITTPTGAFDVQDAQKAGDSVLHVGRVLKGHLESGQPATFLVRDRGDTMRNHTATHLLNWALRAVLGEHVEQKGSLVDMEKTRFDFTHDKPLTAEEIAEVERLVNEKIYLDLPVTPVTMPLAEAKKIAGVRAMFGEKYPDPVRVVMIGAESPEDLAVEPLEHSVEFCGGTHLHHTGEAGFFKIVGQELVGKGVRRVTAVTGRGAVEAVQRLSSVVDGLASRFNCRPEEVSTRIDSLQEEVKKLQQQLRKGAAGDLHSAGDRLFASAAEVNGARIIAGEVPAAPVEQIRQEVDRLRQKAKSAVIVLGWAEDNKVQLLAAVTDDLTAKGAHAGKLVGEVAKLVGGKGGGKPTMAQAGGKDASKLAEAMEQAKKLASEQLKK